MSQTFTQRHDDLICVLAVSAVVGIGIFGMLLFFEWNDEQYFKTLDKLTCEQIWDMMMNGGRDWDTMEYFGTRCNR